METLDGKDRKVTVELYQPILTGLIEVCIYVYICTNDICIPIVYITHIHIYVCIPITQI